MTIHELENYFLDQLSPHYNKSAAGAVCRLVFEEIFDFSPGNLLTSRADEVTETQFQNCSKTLIRLEKGEPIQYVLGKAWFCGMNLKVNRNVLIPRPETEELVHLIAGEVKKKNLRFLDIGTGSGCIAIGLKKLLPLAAITGVDISEKAIDIAIQNANDHLLAVNFHHMDILNYHKHRDFISAYEKFDVIVSNPPYIGTSEKGSMAMNVTSFEPSEALFVPDDDLLLFYRAIGVFAVSFLKENGSIYFEINQNQAENVEQLLIMQGFSDVKIINDMSGNPRFVKAILL